MAKIVRLQMRYFTKHTKRDIVLPIVLLSFVAAIGATANEYIVRSQVLSEQILVKASQLKEATQKTAFNSAEIGKTLTELKVLIKEYEENMVFAQSPYPGEILLGTTPSGASTWLDVLCDGRYDGLLKEIRIRRTGRRANYLRINDIEITYSTPRGLVQEALNENGRVKLYHGGVFRLSLPRPMRIRRIRININHESTGLEVYGIPYMPPAAHNPFRINPGIEEGLYPGEVLLGTTVAGHSTWLETLCSNLYQRPVSQIRLSRTGRKASYLRINDIEITHLTRHGLQKEVFNQGGRVKLYYGGDLRLSLPSPMRITHIRILIDHESTGLKVYGVH